MVEWTSPRETSSNGRTANWVQDFYTDLRRPARLLLHARGFSLVAVLTIGLAIGVITAVFTLVDTVLFKTLPVPEADRLVFVNVASDDGELHGAPPYPGFERLRVANSFSGLAAFRADRGALVIDGRRERALVQLASGSYFEVLRVPAVLGRTLRPEDERLDPPAAVLGYGYWQRRFGGSPDVLGRTIQYQTSVVTIVGVTAPSFTSLQPGQAVDVTVPITLAGVNALRPTRWWLDAVGRLAPGVSRDAAAAELDPPFQAFMVETEASAEMRREFSRIALSPAARGLSDLREEFTRPLLAMLAIAAIVLLIACANIANLLLARAVARRYEFGVRKALGASRSRLVRQLLTESLLLGVIGAAAGGVVAYWLLGVLTSAVPADVVLDLSPNVRVVGFAVLVCISTSLLFGLAPAIRAARVETVADLKNQTGGLRFARRLGFTRGSALVVVQVGLSLILVVATSLLVGTLTKLRSLDMGFQADGVTTFEVEFPPTERALDRLSQRWAMLLEKASAVPGVQSASVSSLMPLGRRDRVVQMRRTGAEPARGAGVVLNHVSAAFFDTMGISVRRGRPITPTDIASAQPVVVLNETAARVHFRGDDPIGQVIQIGKIPREVVGVAADTKHLSVRDRTPSVAYVPVLQPLEPNTSLTLAVRTAGDVGGLTESVRRQLLDTFGSDILIGQVATMSDQINQSLVRERLMASLSGGFGLLGLFLAMVGLFGVLSYNVVQRRREIAVRMAIGARAPEIRWGILRTSLLIAGVGVAIATPLSLLGARALGSLLFGMEPLNVLIVAGSAFGLLTAAMLAAFVPALRASRLEPAAILRDE